MYIIYFICNPVKNVKYIKVNLLHNIKFYTWDRNEERITYNKIYTITFRDLHIIKIN